MQAPTVRIVIDMQISIIDKFIEFIINPALTHYCPVISN